VSCSMEELSSLFPLLSAVLMGLPLYFVGGIGWGLDVDLLQIYDFVCNNYQPGDELFFFGFSRGAFTVRSVAGLICDVGVLSAVNMSHFAEMWAAYRANTGGDPFRQSEWYLNNKEQLGLTDVKIKVVGVWDTVGALVCDEMMMHACMRTCSRLSKLAMARVSPIGL
jgi:uncharacterized protein (DUF2235 family)